MYTPEYIAYTKASEFLSDQQNDHCYLCVPISVEGSYPTPVHAKMAVFPTSFAGTIGGGNIEFRAIKFVQDNFGTLESNYLFHYSMTAEMCSTSNMICGGEVTILIQRVTKQTIQELQRCLDLGNCTEQYTWTGLKPMNEDTYTTTKELIDFQH